MPCKSRIKRRTSNKNCIVIKELKNEGNVVLFPQSLIALYLNNLSSYFTDNEDYVAMGSKRRTLANASYKELVKINNLKKFESYLSSNGYDNSTIIEYVEAIRTLINDSIISENKKIFLAYDSIKDYREAANVFLAIDKIKELDSNNDNVFSYALPLYIDFLITEYGDVITDENNEDMLEDETEMNDEEELCEETELENIDYETPYINNNGFLTRIANPALIDKLRPDLDTEYPRPLSALNTIDEFYGNRFPNMELHNWQDLFDKINWDNPYVIDNTNDEENENDSSNRKKIKVIFPDGKEICEKQVYKTLVEVIKYAGVDNVKKLNITMGKRSDDTLLTSTINEKKPLPYKPIGQGLYVNTYSHTSTKFEQIKQISEELNLSLEVYLV